MLKKRGQGAPSKSDHFFCRFRVCPEGINGALASTGTPFSLWEADPKRPPKGEPKVSVLEAQISTILLFGRPGDQNRLTKERVKKRGKTGAGRGCQGEGHLTLDVLSPPCVY